MAPNSLSSICIPQNGVCTGPYWTKGVANGYIDPKSPDVLTDIGSCALKQVTWVNPSASIPTTQTIQVRDLRGWQQL